MIDTATRVTTLVRVVTATNLIFNERRSFIFMFQSGMPKEWVGESSLWGFVATHRKPDDYFDPWAFAENQRGESARQFVGDDGVPRWDVAIFESGKGLWLACGFDDDAQLQGLRSLVREGSLPPVCVLCMERAVFDRVAPVLSEEGVEVSAHHFDGELTSS